MNGRFGRWCGLLVAGAMLGGCIVEPAPVVVRHGGWWAPGHWTYGGYWVPGHWR